MAQNEVEVDVGDGGGKGGLSMGKIVVILVAVQFMLVIIIGAALYFAGVFDGDSGGSGETQEVAEKSSKPVGDPQYIQMKPPFTVNFGSSGGARFMQVEVQVMTYDKEAAGAIETHQPVLRDRILRVLGDQEEESVRTTAGKDKLREDILQVIRGVMEERYGKPAIEEVYFTSFVIQ
jgi:flagellar FliL protein